MKSLFDILYISPYICSDSVSNGPDIYDGLPGLILEIQINKQNPNSELSIRSYTAVAIK